MIYEERTFEGLELAGETMDDIELTDCTFENCTFMDVKLTRCSLRTCAFRSCRFINPRLEGVRARELSFADCTFFGVHFEEIASGSIGQPVESLQRSCLKYCTFLDMRLNRFDFSAQTLQECVFDSCALAESSFRGSDLQGTQFTGCDLKKADFRDAAGYLIDPGANRVKGARFSFPEVVRLLDGLGIKIDGY